MRSTEALRRWRACALMFDGLRYTTLAIRSSGEHVSKNLEKEQVPALGECAMGQQPSLGWGVR